MSNYTSIYYDPYYPHYLDEKDNNEDDYFDEDSWRDFINEPNDIGDE